MRPLPFPRAPRAPRALPAATIALLGLGDLTVGAFVPQSAPVVLGALAPLGGRLATIVCGLFLLLLAHGVAHGRRAAWLLALLLLAQSAYLMPMEHNGRALIALVPVALLLARRAHFGAPARAPRRGYALLLAGLVLVGVGGSGVHQASGGRRGGADAHVVRAAETRAARTPTPVIVPPRPGQSLLPGLGLGALLLVVGLRGLTAPARPRASTAGQDGRVLAHVLFAAHGDNSVGYFADTADKARWTDPAGRGVVAFRLIGGTALVVGDPLAAPADRPAVLDGFLAHCHDQGWTPAFYQTLGATLPLYRAHGLRALAIGREAVIDLPSFTLNGKKIANVRHSVTHAERAGLRVRLYDAASLDARTRADLVDISHVWLAGKGGGQMGFTMGQLGPAGLPSPGARVAVAYDDAGRARAFITVVPAGGGRGWTLDLMRRHADTESGTMDLLIARVAEALRDAGDATLSLSLAPLASDAASDDEDAPPLARRARTLLYDKMGGAYNYRSLFTYKKKFTVRWETRYLVYAGDAALVGAVGAVAWAHRPVLAGRRPTWPRHRPTTRQPVVQAA